ncbi:hypothetical protein PBI_ORCHID_85 [Gordonia phage Orchid]|nr:hypothetical protein BH761_gp085 [Gordonia phage Orchid]ANA87431.1 hypothetical protein PBI_ORCHID_85 [Gordonia phage Orchid]
MNFTGILVAVAHGIQSAYGMYQQSERERKHFNLQLIMNNTANSVQATDYDNLDKIPREPITVTGLPDAFLAFPYAILADMLYTALHDSDKVAISEPLLKTLVDIASTYDDFNDRSFGALNSVKELLEENRHYSEVLATKRKAGQHF